MLKSISSTAPAISSNSTTGVLQIAGPAAGTTRVMTTPNANFTAARTDAAQSFTGDQTLSTGNLIQGAAAKGVNFTANTPAAGMTSQLLNWYEEGTWTPTITAVSGSYTTVQFQTGRYTRIGRMVHIVWAFTVTSVGTGAVAYRVADIPFAINQSGLTGYTGSGYNNSTAVAHTIYASGSGTTIDVYRYDGTNPVVVNQGMVGSCTYFV